MVRLHKGVVKHKGSVILLSGIFPGWLMGLMSWLVTAGKETISQIFFVWLIAFSIGVGQLHHSIAGSVEILPAVYLELITPTDFLRTLFWMTIGNAIGAFVFVALIKYSHITRSSE
ncbi:MAG: formate/nitrite transporter family protein [Syntrophales bacterium]